MVGISCISIIPKHVMIGQKLCDNEIRDSVSTGREGKTQLRQERKEILLN